MYPNDDELTNGQRFDGVSPHSDAAHRLLIRVGIGGMINAAQDFAKNPESEAWKRDFLRSALTIRCLPDAVKLEPGDAFTVGETLLEVTRNAPGFVLSYGAEFQALHDRVVRSVAHLFPPANEEASDRLARREEIQDRHGRLMLETFRFEDGAAVLLLAGGIGHHTGRAVSKRITELVSEGFTSFQIDVTRCAAIDGAGIEWLGLYRTICDGAGVKLTVIVQDPALRKACRERKVSTTLKVIWPAISNN